MSDYNDFPPELREEHVDALIIYSMDSADDQRRAEQLRSAVEALAFDDGVKGKAVFLDDAVPYVTSQIVRIDEAVKFATLVFVICSEALNKDSVILSSSDSILWNTIEEKARKYSFIPVIHGEQTSRSLLIRCLQPIDTKRSNWNKCLKKKIASCLSKRIDRSKEQARKQQEFLNNKSQTAAASTVGSRHRIEPSASSHCDDISRRQLSIENVDAHADGNVLPGAEEIVDDQNHGRNPFTSWFGENISYIGGAALVFAGFIIFERIRRV